MGLSSQSLAMPEAWAGYAVLACVVLLTSAGLWKGRRQLRGPRIRDQARDSLAGIHAQENLKGEMEQLLVELQDLARQTCAQIDTRFAKLEVCMRCADERIDRLERLLRAAGGQVITGAVLAEASAAARAPESGPAGGQLRETIYALADSGKTRLQIAQATGRLPGEVELILALRPGGPRGDPDHKPA